MKSQDVWTSAAGRLSGVGSRSEGVSGASSRGVAGHCPAGPSSAPLPVCEKDHTLVTRGWARGPPPPAEPSPPPHAVPRPTALGCVLWPPGGFPRTLSWPCPQAARRRSGHVCWDASLRPGPGPRPRRCPGSTAHAGSPSSRVSGRCRVTVTVTSPARGARSTAACSSRL